MTKRMSLETSVAKKKQKNNSLCEHAVIKKFLNGNPKKPIRDMSGHKSVDGLRKHESISENQKESAYHVLDHSNSDAETPDGHTSHDHDFSMQVSAPKVSCQQQQQLQPNLTFGSASFESSTLNIYEAP